ncbi:MAG TPA: hypothetical protein VGM92_07880, partial [Candidatus Kapabacteria bacterium]
MTLQIGTFSSNTEPISTAIPSEDTLVVTRSMPTGFFGLFPARAFIIDSLDEMTTNDTGAFFVAPAIPADSVVINEIMFNSP